jgi:TatD DNase family protein
LGVDRLITIGIERETSLAALALAERFEAVYAAVGIHPNCVQTSAPIPELAEWLRHPKVVAGGEIGLDYHWDLSTPREQEHAFRAQFETIVVAGRPVVLHCREAESALLDLLESYAPVPVPLVFHCFAGDGRDAARALALGEVYFGVDGPVTYKKNEPYRELLRTLPPARLLVETDAPYLTPVPYRGKPNRPGWVSVVADALSGVLGLPAAEGRALFAANAARCFRLSG